jgi:predicted DNA-binding ribbon-helix-helix protein
MYKSVKLRTETYKQLKQLALDKGITVTKLLDLMLKLNHPNPDK